jgi:tetratricopeptide (TPR) repeat protein
MQGRAQLHALNLANIRQARTAFEKTLQSEPDYAPAHIGLANACALLFDASRIDASWDIDALGVALDHAGRATTLAPASGDAWSTLAFCVALQGATEESNAAARKATTLERDNWLHWLRFAFVSWGEDRIRAARTALALYPDLALAHWLIATVLIARGAFASAQTVLRDGCAAQDRQHSGTAFPAVGLHLLRGLVLAAQHDLDASAEAFACELSYADKGQLYSRECRANTWYALAAVRLRQRRRADAEHAFANALGVAPAHLFTLAAIGRALPSLDEADPRSRETALAAAAGLAREGRHADAARAWRAAIDATALSWPGWILPVEPLINPGGHVEAWSDVLAIVRARAA